MSKKEQKKAKGRKRLAILLIIVIAIIVLVVVVVNNNKKNNGEGENVTTVQENEGGSKINISEELKKTKTFYGYEISKTELKQSEGETTFTTTIKNTTQNKIGNESVYIVFKTNSGEEIYKMEVYLPEIEAGDSIDINSTITIDVVGAYDIELVK